MKKSIVAFLAIVSFSANTSAIEQDGCSTKLKQVMRPEYPAVKISGYAIVNFDIKTNGRVENIKSHKSMCLRHNRKEDTYSFESCGAFISKAIAATPYIQFKPPIDINGNACTIKNKKHLYRFMANKNEKAIAAFAKELDKTEES
jgi:hypothetical protein